jgi:hypothetical protein
MRTTKSCKRICALIVLAYPSTRPIRWRGVLSGELAWVD